MSTATVKQMGYEIFLDNGAVQPDPVVLEKCNASLRDVLQRRGLREVSRTEGVSGKSQIDERVVWRVDICAEPVPEPGTVMLWGMQC